MQAGDTLTNQGTITLNNGQYVNQTATTNQTNGVITLAAGDFQNQPGGTLTNQGTITLSNGRYVNQAATDNQSGGAINLTAGDFQNQAGGTLTNQGAITLSTASTSTKPRPTTKPAAPSPLRQATSRTRPAAR